MKTAIKKFFMKISNNFVGKKGYQRFYLRLFYLSLRGLNFSNGGNFRKSGELFVLKFINEKFINEKSLTIFDVGGNIGNYSKELSDFFDSKAFIHSFEPSKKTFETFLKTTKDCKNIISNNFGFSDKENNQLLFTNQDGSGLASIYHRRLDHFGISMDKSENIYLSTIDSYCQKNQIERIHFLKLDIEGHELKALNGAAEMIRNKKIDVIQFEFGGCNIDSRTYFQDFFYLLKDNYHIFRILKDGLYELPTYTESYEIFITINYLAVKK
jgi:FkbM family methyltransferase